MQKILSVAYFHNDHLWLERNGERCWQALCDELPVGQWVSGEELGRAWRKHFPGSPRQRKREAQLVWANVMAQDPSRDDMERAGQFYRFTPRQAGQAS